MTLVEGLPEWFDATAREESIPIDLRHQTVFVANEQDTIVGFVSLFVFQGRLEIGWLGVDRRRRRAGIGRQLLDHAAGHARSLGISKLAAHTLGDAVDYAPYAETRAFYYAQGFKVASRAKTDNPGCPEEILVVKDIDLLRA